MLIDKRTRSHFHWPLFWCTILLSGIGLLNLFSATYHLNTAGPSSLFYSQLLWFGLGLTVAVFVLLIDYRIFLRFAYPLYWFSVFLLVLVFFFGKEVAGNRNWLVLGPITMQPSEFAKMAFIFGLARYLAEHPSVIGYGLRELVRPFLILMIPLGLILLEKDLGSSLFLMLTFGTLMLFAGVQKKIVLVTVVIAMIGSAVAYKTILLPHQRARIESFLHPDEDPRGRGYHLIQSKIAVGSGEFLGKGYLKGFHNKLLYLPEKHTDFIFPVLAEEWGFVGSAVVLGLYLAILLMSLQITMRAREGFGLYMALGITSLFFWQVVINLGGVLGLMPLTGVTLPLLSYGGSSLITIFVGISLLLNIWMRRFLF